MSNPVSTMTGIKNMTTATGPEAYLEEMILFIYLFLFLNTVATAGTPKKNILACPRNLFIELPNDLVLPLLYVQKTHTRKPCHVSIHRAATVSTTAKGGNPSV